MATGSSPAVFSSPHKHTMALAAFQVGVVWGLVEGALAGLNWWQAAVCGQGATPTRFSRDVATLFIHHALPHAQLLSGWCLSCICQQDCRQHHAAGHSAPHNCRPPRCATAHPSATRTARCSLHHAHSLSLCSTPLPVPSLNTIPTHHKHTNKTEARRGTRPRCPHHPQRVRCGPRLNRTEVIHSHRPHSAGKVGVGGVDIRQREGGKAERRSVHWASDWVVNRVRLGGERNGTALSNIAMLAAGRWGSLRARTSSVLLLHAGCPPFTNCRQTPACKKLHPCAQLV